MADTAMKQRTADIIDRADTLLAELDRIHRREEDRAVAAIVVPLLEADFDRKFASSCRNVGVDTVRHMIELFDDVPECRICETWSKPNRYNTHSFCSPARWPEPMTTDWIEEVEDGLTDAEHLAYLRESTLGLESVGGGFPAHDPYANFFS